MFRQLSCRSPLQGGEVSPIISPFTVGAYWGYFTKSIALLPPLGTIKNISSISGCCRFLAVHPHRLGGLHGNGGTWSPDGSGILFANDHDLYIASADGSGTKRMASLQDIPGGYDGHRMVREFVFQFSITRTEQTRCGRCGQMEVIFIPCFPGWNNPSQECCGNWTSDGQYFIFQSTHDGNTQIWSIREKRGYSARQVGADRIDDRSDGLFHPGFQCRRKKLLPSDPKRGESLQRYNQRRPSNSSHIFRAFRQKAWNFQKTGNG